MRPDEIELDLEQNFRTIKDAKACRATGGSW